MGPSLDAPLVSPLNCMAMAVELPPISTADSCSMTGREVVVQMRLPGEPWGDVQRDVQSGSVIVGDLDPLQAVEFRIALRRPGQPDWVGQETQRMVTEEVLSPEQLCLGRQRAAEGREREEAAAPPAPPSPDPARPSLS